MLPYLVDWDSDLILRHARAELLVAGEGFHIPSGVLHAPGTALTLELQEDSDVLAMFQALNAGKIISKELLFKDVRPRTARSTVSGSRSGFVDWELNGDPYFYENRHLTPQPVSRADGDAGRRGVLGLLQHRQVQREAAGRPAGSTATAARARRLQRSSSGRARVATPDMRCAAGRATSMSS